MVDKIIRIFTKKLLDKIMGRPHPASNIGGSAAVILFKLGKLARNIAPLDEIEFTCNAIIQFMDRGEELKRKIPLNPMVPRLKLTNDRYENLRRFQNQSQQLYDACRYIIDNLEVYVRESDAIMQKFKLAKHQVDRLDNEGKKRKEGLAFQTKIILVRSRLEDTETFLELFRPTVQSLKKRLKNYKGLVGEA